MINTVDFYDYLRKKNIDFFSGVPDSLLKDFCAYISDNVSDNMHIITANEGSAIGLAVGYYLSTKKIPLIYMQNSGLGNTVNPILSMADDLVYGIPMLLLIGWRGEPGIKDEPQHIRQGQVTEELLFSMKIPYTILDAKSDFKKVIDEAIESANSLSKPFAIIVKADTFEKYKLINQINTSFELNREGAIKLITESLKESDIVVSTTGKASRELFEYRENLNQSHEKDFLTVGAMGHTSSIAMGIALQKSNQNVYCLDGDGSVLMHMGSLAINGQLKGVKNFKHIVINNGAHDSVGGQPTVGFDVDFASIAKACGYDYVGSASTSTEIVDQLFTFSNYQGLCFLEIKVNKGSRDNLGRPSTTPKENKNSFINFLNNDSDNP
jgi:phosphonopyruvate decarboxylase